MMITKSRKYNTTQTFASTTFAERENTLHKHQILENTFAVLERNSFVSTSDYLRTKSYSRVFASYSCVIESYSRVFASYSCVIESYNPVIGTYSRVIESYNAVIASYSRVIGTYSPVIEPYSCVKASYSPVIVYNGLVKQICKTRKANDNNENNINLISKTNYYDR